MAPKSSKHARTEQLNDGPLHYGPENELGVVFLFAHLAKKWRLRIEEIRAAFPDCIAYQKTQGGEKRVRIEFELKSRNFSTHRHQVSKCDWIVCWEHNWPDAPKGLHIVELRREFGLGFNVWIMPTNDPYKKELKSATKPIVDWSVPSQAHTTESVICTTGSGATTSAYYPNSRMALFREGVCSSYYAPRSKGDLILFYLTAPDSCISAVGMLRERAAHITAGWKPGKDYMAPMKRVCTLKSPVFLEDMRRHRILKTSHFIRGGMQGRPNATEYWPYLHDIIVRRNPSAKRLLARFAPENLA